MNESDAQPTGKELSRTADVVHAILTDPDIFKEVKEHNGWPNSLLPVETALLFLAVRFQEAMALLSLRTTTLKREVDGAVRRLEPIEENFYSEGNND